MGMSSDDNYFGTTLPSNAHQYPIPSATVPSQATHSYPPAPQINYASEAFIQDTDQMGNNLIHTYPGLTQPPKDRTPPLQRQNLPVQLARGGYGQANSSHNSMFGSAMPGSAYRDQMVSSPIDSTFDSQFPTNYFTTQQDEQLQQPTSMPANQGYGDGRQANTGLVARHVLPSQRQDQRFGDLSPYGRQQQQQQQQQPPYHNFQ